MKMDAVFLPGLSGMTAADLRVGRILSLLMV